MKPFAATSPRFDDRDDDVLGIQVHGRASHLSHPGGKSGVCRSGQRSGAKTRVRQAWNGKARSALKADLRSRLSE